MAIINLPSSNPQTMVASALEQIRKLFLHDALANAIQSADLSEVNAQLESFAPVELVRTLAARGIRGEFLFATPVLLSQKPNLLGYYRLLLGYSQKEFYNKGGLGRFMKMESGEFPARAVLEVDDLCRALNERAADLLHGIGPARINLRLLEDLALLTLGPQLRGGNNTRIGQMANRTVFEIIQQIIAPVLSKATASQLELVNAAGRKITITFSSDPDISVFEELGGGRIRNVIAIEIKGGTDKSNIWNRLGEAEKSHQSAKQRGFVQFWTIYNVPGLSLPKAREKSPTTQRFFSLIELSSGTGEEFSDFRDQFQSLIGIRA